MALKPKNALWAVRLMVILAWVVLPAILPTSKGYLSRLGPSFPLFLWPSGIQPWRGASCQNHQHYITQLRIINVAPCCCLTVHSSCLLVLISLVSCFLVLAIIIVINLLTPFPHLCVSPCLIPTQALDKLMLSTDSSSIVGCSSPAAVN